MGASVLVMAAPLVGMRGIAVAIGALPTSGNLQRRPIRPDQKSASGERMIMMRHKPAFGFDPKVQQRDRRLHLQPVFREGVEECRDEHVA